MEPTILKSELLDQYMTTFLGFGDLEARFWFVGMEEGGGDTFDDVNGRLLTWSGRGHNELEHIRDYHDAHGLYPEWFRKSQPRIQPTWGASIRISLLLQGRSDDRESVRKYQVEEFARPGSPECLMELSPLPSPGLDKWRYDEFSVDARVRTRAAYRSAIFPMRRRLIADKIRTHHPEVVVFYGLGYRDQWSEIADGDLVAASVDSVFAERRGQTTFAFLKHPVARGLKRQYFADVADVIANLRT